MVLIKKQTKGLFFDDCWNGAISYREKERWTHWIAWPHSTWCQRELSWERQNITVRKNLIKKHCWLDVFPIFQVHDQPRGQIHCLWDNQNSLSLYLFYKLNFEWLKRTKIIVWRSFGLLKKSVSTLKYLCKKHNWRNWMSYVFHVKSEFTINGMRSGLTGFTSKLSKYLEAHAIQSCW